MEDLGIRSMEYQPVWEPQGFGQYQPFSCDLQDNERNDWEQTIKKIVPSNYSNLVNKWKLWDMNRLPARLPHGHVFEPFKTRIIFPWSNITPDLIEC